MTVKKVTVEPGCISCGSCAFIAPEIFEVTDRSRVKPDGDITGNSDAIIKAAKACPVNVIRYEE